MALFYPHEIYFFDGQLIPKVISPRGIIINCQLLDISSNIGIMSKHSGTMYHSKVIINITVIIFIFLVLLGCTSSAILDLGIQGC